MAKIEVTSNMGIMGMVSPYSYQVAPKTWNSFGESDPRKQLKWADGEAQQCRFTQGQGKATGMKYFVYFKLADRQEWIELTPDTFNKLKADKSLTIELKPVVKAAEEPAKAAELQDKAEDKAEEQGQTEEPKVEEPAKEEPAKEEPAKVEPAHAKGKKAARA